MNVPPIDAVIQQYNFARFLFRTECPKLLLIGRKPGLKK